MSRAAQASCTLPDTCAGPGARHGRHGSYLELSANWTRLSTAHAWIREAEARAPGSAPRTGKSAAATAVTGLLRWAIHGVKAEDLFAAALRTVGQLPKRKASAPAGRADQRRECMQSFSSARRRDQREKSGEEEGRMGSSKIPFRRLQTAPSSQSLGPAANSARSTPSKQPRALFVRAQPCQEDTSFTRTRATLNLLPSS